MAEQRNGTGHECVFVEEAEPGGRLVLPPCLVCGLTAMDALAQQREALDLAFSWISRQLPGRESSEATCAWVPGDVYDRIARGLGG